MMRSPGVHGRLSAAAFLLLLSASSPAAAQYGGMGGMGGIGTGMGTGMGSGMGSGAGGSAGSGAFQSPRLSFRPWISANGTYSETLASGLTGAVPTRGTYGYGGAAGLSGGKSFTRTMVAAFYTGSYQHYNTQMRRGYSQTGGVSVQHQASERFSLFASEFAGSSNGGYGYGAAAGSFGGWGVTGSSVFSDLGAGGIGFGDPASNGLVDNELFVSRVNYTGTTGGFSYQPNMRWSFGGMGTGSFVRRKGTGLANLNSYSTGGHAAYRLSQFSQLGVYYQYGQFSYPNLFGGNRVQQAGLMFKQKLGQQTSLSLMAGGYRFNTNRLGQVAMDPTLAGLLGQGTTLSILQLQRLGWSGSAALARAWHTWSAGVSYNHGISPGNGLMLASQRDSVVGNMSTNVGRLSVGGFGGYYRLAGVLQDGARTQNYSVGASTGFRIAGDLYLGASAGFSRYETNAAKAQWRRFVSVHLSWSPEDAAFRF